MKIVEFSIKRPVTVTMLFVAIAVFGVVSYDQLALNLLPEISYPTLTVRTEYEAAAPAEEVADGFLAPEHFTFLGRGVSGVQRSS